MRSHAPAPVAALVLLALLASPALAARQRSTSGPIDRTAIQDDDFCPSEISVTPGDFIADGLEATVEFRARNLGYEFPPQGRAAGQPTLWMFSSIDAVSVLQKFFHEQNYIQLPCLACDSTGQGQALAWDQVNPADFTYFESFANGIPQEWFLGDGAWENDWNDPTDRTSSNTPSDSVDCLGDRSGSSLGLGEFTNPSEFVSTYATIPDLIPDEEYVLSFWWHARPDSDETNGDLEVTIWGEEPWEDVTPAAAGTGTTTWAAAWADVDGDGFEDLYLARGLGSTPKNQLLKNDGGTGFVDVTSGVLDDPGDAGSATFADVDNDGDPDLFLANWDATGNRLLRNDGGFAFSDVTPAGMNPSSTAWASSFADYDRDGDVDVYVSRFSAANSLYRNDGSFQFTDVAQGEILVGPSSHGIAWGDYDNDGDPDLYVTRYNLVNRLFRNDDGSFTNVASGPSADIGPARDAAFGDYDNDGDLDLAVANFGAGDLLLENQGEGTFVDVTPPALAVARSSNAITWHDVDLDGDLDLFIATEGTNSLLLNDGGGVWVESIGGPFPRTDPFVSVGGAFSDTDGDGDEDLLVANRVFASDQLFRNDDGAGEHWLAINLQGTLSNAAGVGARIEVTAGGVAQHRDAGFDAAFSSQGTPRTHFGFGPVASIDALTVHWPSGISQAYDPPAVDQRVVLVENDGTGVVTPENRPPAFALGRPSPNPFGSVSTIPFELPRRAHAHVEVFDVTGRRVATLVDRPLEPGRTEARWDARDAQGMRVSSGIYFVRLRAEDFTASRKVTLR